MACITPILITLRPSLIASPQRFPEPECSVAGWLSPSFVGTDLLRFGCFRDRDAPQLGCDGTIIASRQPMHLPEPKANLALGGVFRKGVLDLKVPWRYHPAIDLSAIQEDFQAI